MVVVIVMVVILPRHVPVDPFRLPPLSSNPFHASSFHILPHESEDESEFTPPPRAELPQEVTVSFNGGRARHLGQGCLSSSHGPFGTLLVWVRQPIHLVNAAAAKEGSKHGPTHCTTVTHILEHAGQGSVGRFRRTK